MKNIIYCIALIFSSNIYSQNDIEKDQLFLKYEEEYVNLTISDYVTKYEEANRDFNKKFDYKRKKTFEKSKNKERWLQNNYSKIAFNSPNEALESYANLNKAKLNLDEVSNKVDNLHKELIQKYGVTLIWETLQSRLKK